MKENEPPFGRLVFYALEAFAGILVVAVIAIVPVATVIIVTPVLITIAPLGEAMHRAFAEAFAHSLMHAVPDQSVQAALLRVVELVVKRLRGIGEAFQIGARLGHDLGAAAKTLHGVGTIFFVLVPFRAALFTAHLVFLRHVLEHGFDRRPEFFLFRVKPEARVKCRDARIRESGAIGGRGFPLIFHARLWRRR